MNAYVKTKPTRLHRVLMFLAEYCGLIILAVTVIAMVVLVVATYTPRKYLNAPVESCNSVYTGQQKNEEYIVYQCAAYDVKMNCTVQMPVVYQSTYKEVNNQCNWNEWR